MRLAELLRGPFKIVERHHRGAVIGASEVFRVFPFDPPGNQIAVMESDEPHELWLNYMLKGVWRMPRLMGLATLLTVPANAKRAAGSLGKGRSGVGAGNANWQITWSIRIRDCELRQPRVNDFQRRASFCDEAAFLRHGNVHRIYDGHRELQGG